MELVTFTGQPARKWYFYTLGKSLFLDRRQGKQNNEVSVKLGEWITKFVRINKFESIKRRKRRTRPLEVNYIENNFK